MGFNSGFKGLSSNTDITIAKIRTQSSSNIKQQYWSPHRHVPFLASRHSSQSCLRTGPCSSRTPMSLNTTVKQRDSWGAEESHGILSTLRNSVASFNIGRKVSRCGGLAMVQEVSLRLLNAMARVWSQTSHVLLIVNTCYWDRIFPSSFGFSLSLSFHQCSILIHSFIHSFI